MSDHNTTCQICGRAIKSAKGVIAHHGYRRPGEGWQTASCMGARFRPYEVASDRIADAIRAVESHIASKRVWLAELEAGPAVVTYSKRVYETGQIKLIEVAKPADFNPANAHAASFMRSYAQVRVARMNEARRDIRGSEETRAYLVNRLEAWRPL